MFINDIFLELITVHNNRYICHQYRKVFLRSRRFKLTIQWLECCVFKQQLCDGCEEYGNMNIKMTKQVYDRGKLTTKLFHKNGTKLMTSEIKEVLWFVFLISIYDWNFVWSWYIQQLYTIDLLGVVKSTQGMCYSSINCIHVQINDYRRWIITQNII